MKIELLGWESKGLRCPDARIWLGDEQDNVPCVSLIQMPNGTGKTTTLDCLRAAMDGSAMTWSAEHVAPFQCKATTPEEGKFIATFRLNDTKRMVIEMNFYFGEYNQVVYRTTYGSRNDEGYKPPPEVARYLQKQFSGLLFFNGELANNLIDGSNNTNAAEIIDTFYGLYQLTELKRLARSSYDQYVAKKKSVKVKSLRKIEEDLKRWRTRRDKLRSAFNTAKSEREELQMAIATLEKETEEHLLKSSQFQKEEQAALAARNKATTEVDSALERISNQFPNPVFLNPGLASELKMLADNLNTLKLPEHTSKIFFEELLKEPVCICDRAMDDASKTAIEKRQQAIMGDAITGFLNNFKSAVWTHCDSPPEPSFEKLLTELETQQEIAVQAQSKLDNILHEAELAGDQQVQEKSKLLKEKQASLPGIQKQIEDAERPSHGGDDDDSGCLDYFNKKIEEGERRQAELSDSLDKKLKTDALIDLLDTAYRRTHDELKAQVIADANSQLRSILKLNLVQIDDIANSVKLLSQAQGSVGQNLSVGYVFLAGILHGGGNQFPLVVDSPAGALDHLVREEVGRLLPQLIGQLVAFVIPSERQWFIKPLAEAAKDSVQYLTQLRLNDYTREVIPKLGGSTVSESADGIVIDGRDAFFSLGEEVDSEDEPKT